MSKELIIKKRKKELVNILIGSVVKTLIIIGFFIIIILKDIPKDWRIALIVIFSIWIIARLIRFGAAWADLGNYKKDPHKSNEDLLGPRCGECGSLINLVMHRAPTGKVVYYCSKHSKNRCSSCGTNYEVREHYFRDRSHAMFCSRCLRHALNLLYGDD